MPALIARFMGPTWGPSGADMTQVGPMLAPWTLLSGCIWFCVGMLKIFLIFVEHSKLVGLGYQAFVAFAWRVATRNLRQSDRVVLKTFSSMKCPASLRWALAWENTDICQIYTLYIYIYIYEWLRLFPLKHLYSNKGNLMLQWPVVSSHIGPVIQKIFPCHDLIMSDPEEKQEFVTHWADMACTNPWPDLINMFGIGAIYVFTKLGLWNHKALWNGSP